MDEVIFSGYIAKEHGVIAYRSHPAQMVARVQVQYMNGRPMFKLQDAQCRQMAAAEDLTQAGKHLAVKLAECYTAAGLNPQDCQAIVNFNDLIKKMEAR